MELIKLGDLTKLTGQYVATIGMFDGVHLGHQKILERMKNIAKGVFKTIVITFYPHPDYVLNKRKDYGYIDILENKVANLSKYDIDYVLVIDFTKEFATLSSEEFINIIKTVNIVTFVIGSDFKFGYKGQGNYRDLMKIALVDVVEEVKYKDDKLGSNTIRNLLSIGNVSQANKLLGRNYSISGIVKYGRQIGHKLGFPTANIDVEETFLKNGVYISKVFISDDSYYAVCNLGNNPTLNYVNKRRLEVHIINFKEDIYNQYITVEFIDFIRDEIKFETKEQLIKQISEDVEKVKQYI